MTNLTNSVAFDTTDENNYSDYDLGKGQWVYFREVLLVTSDRSFVGLGLGKFDGKNVSVSYLGAKRNSYERETFESEYFLPRAYTYDYHAASGKQTPLSAVYEPWDDSKPIDLLFDDDDTNWIHSGKSDISAEHPFEITADLGENMLANRFTIYGEPSRQYQPKDFKLYGGTSLKAMELIADVENAARTGSDVIVGFAERRIKYYRLVVTDTWATTQNYRYIAFRCAKFSYSLIGGKWMSPDDGAFGYFGEWKLSNELSTFGHLYEGEKDSALEFSFDGSRFAIFGYVSADYDGYEVLVDGVLSGNVKLGGDDNDTPRWYSCRKT